MNISILPDAVRDVAARGSQFRESDRIAQSSRRRGDRGLSGPEVIEEISRRHGLVDEIPFDFKPSSALGGRSR